jgi:hypothetical protein
MRAIRPAEDLMPAWKRRSRMNAARLIGLSAGVALLIAGAAEGAQTPKRLLAGGYWLYPAPPVLAMQCTAAQKHVNFTVLCPTFLPRSGDGANPATASQLPPGDAGVVAKTFAQWADYPKAGDAAWLYVGGSYGGGETDPQDWSGNNPNYFFHFFVQEGTLSSKTLNLSGVPHPQRFFGRRTIGGHVGSLYDQVSYSICSDCSFTGHVTFVWQQHGVTYAASLHRWSARPSRSVLAVLDSIVAHLRAE